MVAPYYFRMPLGFVDPAVESLALSLLVSKKY
jgi:hypothetical protein